MLIFLSYAMITCFMYLIMSKRLSPLVALLLVPIAFGCLAGFAPQLGTMMFDGVKMLAPTGIMLTFAILYFCMMTDAGLFNPLIKVLLRLVQGDPASARPCSGYASGWMAMALPPTSSPPPRCCHCTD